MFIIVIGNPVDGFEFFGAFETKYEAIDEAGLRFKHCDWWVAVLHQDDN